jgi:hypothetical protein
VDHSSTVTPLAPTTFTIETTSRSAIFLELHLGTIVGAVALVLDEGVGQLRNGGLRGETKNRSAEFLCELVRLREYMIGAGFSDFDALARRRSIEVLVACDTPPATAEFLVDSALELLNKLVRQQAN